MKISFVTSTLHSGGAERVISLLANEMSRRNNSVEIICFNRQDIFYQIECQVEIVFLEVEAKTQNLIKKILWFRSYIKKNKPDVVIPFMTDVYSVTLLSLVGVNIPIISSERIDPRFSDLFYKALRFFFLPLTSHLVVQTEEIKNYYPSFIRKKTSVIYNPVDENVFKKLQVKKNDVIISVGRLARQKNFTLLIKAFHNISYEFPNYVLIILGEGPLRESLESLIDSLNLRGRVFLPGSTKYVLDELRKAKLFCMSSNGEGMSNAMIEAICVGLPIVTTRVSGADELLENGVNGYVTPVNNLKQYSEALRKMLSDEKRMTEMGKRNLEKSQKFEMHLIVQKWESIINYVIQNSKAK